MQYNVTIGYKSEHYPLTGCHNTVEAVSPFIALNKVMAYHKLQSTDITHFNVELTQVFPPIRVDFESN